MTGNPFETEVGEKTQNPFSSVVMAGVTEKAAQAVRGEAEDLLLQSENLKHCSDLVKRSRMNVVRQWLMAKARLILANLSDFVVKAIQLAVFKFVLEMCAQILKNVMEALVSKGFSPLDISTQGVSYNSNGQPRPTTSNGSPFGPTPFDSPFGNSGYTRNPWS